MKKVLSLACALLVPAALLLAGEVRLDVQERVLGNGMKILMIPRPGVPRVVCHVYYKVGSINERPGTTGAAHVHEHLMFKGTRVMGVTDFDKDAAIDRQIDEVMAKLYREKYWKADGGDKAAIAELQKAADGLISSEKPFIVKDDLWTVYMKNGGTGLNASTGQETTGYYVTLPSNKVELQMLLESDRMMNACFREFYSEKDVIMEERRLSENSPGYLFDEQVQAAFFAASPYHWDVVGWMDDLRKMTKSDLVDFHNRYYVPNNAVAIYVGDFDPSKVAALAETYFGRIPRGPDVEPIRTLEPPQYSEKRLYGEGAAPTSLQMMFHIPADGHPDTAALQILSGVLSGETGRLTRSLVKGKEMAVSVRAMARPMWYVGSFEFNATPRLDKNVKPEDLEAEVWAEIDRVKASGVTAEEMEKAKNRAEAQFLRALQSSMGLASRVGRAELNRGWRALPADLDALKAVTADDVKRVAARYFVKDNSLTAIFRRKSGR